MVYRQAAQRQWEKKLTARAFAEGPSHEALQDAAGPGGLWPGFWDAPHRTPGWRRWLEIWAG